MSVFFYVMLVVFVINDLYYLLNRKRLSSNFDRRDLQAVSRLDLLHYFLKSVSVVWPFLGIFTPFTVYFTGVIVSWILKFVSYHVNERIYAIYAIFVPFIVGFIYISVFVMWITN